MEKYSQFRDRASGIAPFFPIPRESSGIYLPLHILFFVVRVPLVLTVGLSYVLAFSWMPAPAVIHQGALWLILQMAGAWWVDLQIDGVKRGSLSKHHDRFPSPGSVVASSFTSPIDCLYLAVIFNPIFTASYPNSVLVERISLFQAMLRALSAPRLTPPIGARLVTLASLMKENPGQTVVVFPECTTSNGRGILTFSPSILSAPPSAKIFPVCLRYTPSDVTTPLPGAYLSFLWDLCSRPTHCIRVRIAEAVRTSELRKFGARDLVPEGRSIIDTFSSAETLTDELSELEITGEEKKLLDRVAEDLARLGRAKRVGLGVQSKIAFIKVWKKTRTIW